MASYASRSPSGSGLDAPARAPPVSVVGATAKRAAENSSSIPPRSRSLELPRSMPTDPCTSSPRPSRRPAEALNAETSCSDQSYRMDPSTLPGPNRAEATALPSPRRALAPLRIALHDPAIHARSRFQAQLRRERLRSRERDARSEIEAQGGCARGVGVDGRGADRAIRRTEAGLALHLRGVSEARELDRARLQRERRGPERHGRQLREERREPLEGPSSVGAEEPPVGGVAVDDAHVLNERRIRTEGERSASAPEAQVGREEVV